MNHNNQCLNKNQSIAELAIPLHYCKKSRHQKRQAVKQASRNESNDQAFILAIKLLDRRRSWKYKTHTSDYPLTQSTDNNTLRFWCICTSSLSPTKRAWGLGYPLKIITLCVCARGVTQQSVCLFDSWILTLVNSYGIINIITFLWKGPLL